MSLPGSPGPKLQAAYAAIPERARQTFLDHLLGGTSADWLSDWLRRAGTPVSATQIKVYRRTLEDT